MTGYQSIGHVVQLGGHTLHLTSSWAPEQYDVLDAEGTLVGYLRLRGGVFTAHRCSGDLDSAEVEWGPQVYQYEWPNDPYKGGFDSQEEREEQLTRAIAALSETGERIPALEEWTTEELQRDFEVVGFQAPYVVVRRRSDGQLGSMQFDHHPRRYYGWQPHDA